MPETMDPKPGDTWYRFSDNRVGIINEWDELIGTRVELSEIRLTVSSVTPKGVWLSWGFAGSKDRFVLLSAKKRYAHPSKVEALKSFMARKERQEFLLTKQIQHVQTAHAKAKCLLARLDSTADKPNIAEELSACC